MRTLNYQLHHSSEQGACGDNFMKKQPKTEEIGLRRCREAFARMVRTQPMRLPTRARACVARRGVVRAREAGRSQGAAPPAARELRV